MRNLITLILFVGLVSRAFSLTCYTDTDATVVSDDACDACYFLYDANYEITERGCTATGSTCDSLPGQACCDSADNCNDGTIVACYVGEPSSNSDLTDASFCEDASAKYCGIAFTGSTISERECLASCDPSATQACCTSNNCNDATDLTTTCIQTAEAGDDSFVCAAAEAYCVVDFSGDTPIKSCEDYCWEDPNVGCCTGEDCNTAEAVDNTCLTCYDMASCANPISSACAMSADDFGGCYTLFYEGVPRYKDCYGADETVCDDHDDIICCTEDDCNDDEEYNSALSVKSSLTLAILISSIVSIMKILFN